MPVEIWGVTAMPDAPCCKSNIWHRLITVPKNADKQVDAVLELASNRDSVTKPVLLLSQDDLVQAVSNRREELKDYFELPLPDKDATSLMLDKTKFQTWARENGYAVPVGTIVKNREELIEAAVNTPLPYLIKPLFRMPEWDAVMGNQKLLWIKDRKSSPWENRDLFELSERLLIQSWIEGDDSDVYFCLYAMDEHGDVLDEVSGRKLTQWPKLTGSTAICHSFDSPYLLDLGREILQKAGLKGLGSVEFKQDKRDGIYYITEPTVGRNDHQSAIAIPAGHNPTAALVSYILELNETTKAIKQKRSGIWIDELATFRFFDKEKTWHKLIKIMLKNIIYGLPYPLFFNLKDRLPFISLVKSKIE